MLKFRTEHVRNYLGTPRVEPKQPAFPLYDRGAKIQKSGKCGHSHRSRSPGVVDRAATDSNSRDLLTEALPFSFKVK